MDGSGAASLLYPPLLSLSEQASRILYVEDFDMEAAQTAEIAQDETEQYPPEPHVTLADLEAAREEGRSAGLHAALEDAQMLQAQMQAADMHSLADALNAAQATLIKIARQTAEDGVRIILSVLQAAIPAVMEQYEALETEAVFRVLMSSISLEPELRVRAHPDATDHIRDVVAGLLPFGMAILSVTADPTMTRGDVQVAWRDGGAVRSSAHIWGAVREALAPLCLPAIEELCHGCRK